MFSFAGVVNAVAVFLFSFLLFFVSLWGKSAQRKCSRSRSDIGNPAAYANLASNELIRVE